jgi:hypothetical protein
MLRIYEGCSREHEIRLMLAHCEYPKMRYMRVFRKRKNEGFLG